MHISFLLSKTIEVFEDPFVFSCKSCPTILILSSRRDGELAKCSFIDRTSVLNRYVLSSSRDGEFAVSPSKIFEDLAFFRAIEFRFAYNCDVCATIVGAKFVGKYSFRQLKLSFSNLSPCIESHLFSLVLSNLISFPEAREFWTAIPSARKFRTAIPARPEIVYVAFVQVHAKVARRAPARRISLWFFLLLLLLLLLSMLLNTLYTYIYIYIYIYIVVVQVSRPPCNSILKCLRNCSTFKRMY